MTRDITLELLQATNPVPQPESLADNLGIADNTLLLLINERSVAMSTNTEHEATQGIPDLTDASDTGARCVRAIAERGGLLLAPSLSS